jgi:hypothetical protein
VVRGYAAYLWLAEEEEAAEGGAAAAISTPKPALPLAHMPEAVRPDGTPLARTAADQHAAESDVDSPDSAGSGAEAKMADDGTGHHLQGCINQVPQAHARASACSHLGAQTRARA